MLGKTGVNVRVMARAKAKRGPTATTQPDPPNSLHPSWARGPYSHSPACIQGEQAYTKYTLDPSRFFARLLATSAV